MAVGKQKKECILALYDMSFIENKPLVVKSFKIGETMTKQIRGKSGHLHDASGS